MGKQKKYKPKALADAVEKYFLSISRETVLTEKKPSGRYDDKGHMIYEDVPVVNSLGEEMKVTQYLVPPTVGGLCAYLGIHRDTWNAYSNDAAYSDTTARARGRMHAYLEQEMLTRSGKDLKGVLFNLENNYGYKEHMEVSSSMEDYLKQLLEQGEGGQQF